MPGLAHEPSTKVLHYHRSAALCPRHCAAPMEGCILSCPSQGVAARADFWLAHFVLFPCGVHLSATSSSSSIVSCKRPRQWLARTTPSSSGPQVCAQCPLERCHGGTSVAVSLSAFSKHYTRPSPSSSLCNCAISIFFSLRQCMILTTWEAETGSSFLMVLGAENSSDVS